MYDKKTLTTAFLGYNDIAKFGYFCLRVFLGACFIFHGASKLFGGMLVFTSVMKGFGIPFAEVLAYGVAYTELIAGILLVFGLLTRLSALAIMIIMYSAIFLAHFNDPFTLKQLPVIFFFVSLLYFLGGGGDHSLDALLMDKMHLEHKSRIKI